MANGRITPHPDTSLKQRAFSGPALEDSTRSWMLLTHPYATSPLPREIKMQAPKCQGTRSRPLPVTAPPRPRPPGLGTLFVSARCPFLPVNLSSPVLTRSVKISLAFSCVCSGRRRHDISSTIFRKPTHFKSFEIPSFSILRIEQRASNTELHYNYKCVS